MLSSLTKKLSRFNKYTQIKQTSAEKGAAWSSG